MTEEVAVDLIHEKPVRTVDTIEKPMIYTKTRDVPVNKLIQKTNAH